MKFYNQDDKQVTSLNEARCIIFTDSEIKKCERGMFDYVSACASLSKLELVTELRDILEDPLFIPNFYYPVALVSDTVKSMLIKFAGAPIDISLYPKCPKCNTNADVTLAFARDSHTHICDSRYHNDAVISFTPRR